MASRCSLPKALTESFVSRPIGWSVESKKEIGGTFRHLDASLPGRSDWTFFFNTKKHDLLWESHVNLKKDWNSMKFYSIPSISDKVGYGLLGFVTWLSIVESWSQNWARQRADCTWLTDCTYAANFRHVEFSPSAVPPVPDMCFRRSGCGSEVATCQLSVHSWDNFWPCH